jgi:hypothetical protein
VEIPWKQFFAFIRKTISDHVEVTSGQFIRLLVVSRARYLVELLVRRAAVISVIDQPLRKVSGSTPKDLINILFYPFQLFSSYPVQDAWV